MNRLINITGTVLLSMALMACEDIYEGGNVQPIDLPVQLKATVIPFDRDDPESLPASQSLGVFMTPSDSENGITGATCMEMTADTDGNLSRKGIDEPFLYPQDVQKVNFVCFTPFTSPISADGTIQVDVSTPALASACDYLYAVSRNKYPALAPVKMQLGHILASVYFDVKPGEGFTVADMQSMTLTIEESASKASFSLGDGTFTLADTDGDITLTTAADGSRVTGLVVPQQRNLVLRCAIGGLEFHKTLGPMKFESGRRYRYDMIVSVPGIEVTLREIEDWKVEVYD